MYLVFECAPDRVTVSDSGLCCCIPCLLSAMISHCLLVSISFLVPLFVHLELEMFAIDEGLSDLASVYARARAGECVRVSVCLSVCLYICMYIYVWVCVDMCGFVRVPLCVCACSCVCVCVCVFV